MTTTKPIMLKRSLASAVAALMLGSMTGTALANGYWTDPHWKTQLSRETPATKTAEPKGRETPATKTAERKDAGREASQATRAVESGSGDAFFYKHTGGVPPQ